MAKVPNGVETLPNILIAWVGRSNVTDERLTGDDIIWYIDKVNVSSRSVKLTYVLKLHAKEKRVSNPLPQKTESIGDCRQLAQIWN